MRSTAFSIRATDEAWQQHWQPVPAPGWHDLFALTKRGAASIEGDLRPLLQNLQYFKDLLALPRRLPEEAESMAPALEPMVGRYLRLEIDGVAASHLFRGGRPGHPAGLPAHRRRRQSPVPPSAGRSRDHARASACWPSTCRGTASRRRPTAGSAASTG